MSNRTLSQLKDEAEDCYAIYAARFAGMPRATRDVSEIDDLIRRLTSVIEEGRTKKDPAMSGILENAQESLQRYKDERSQIVSAQANPDVVYAAELASRANRIFDVYTRHFAGQSRDTRDFRLLEELIEELDVIANRMAPLTQRGIEAARRDLDTVRSQSSLYTDEIEHIRNARGAGTPDEKASRLAQLANDQFKIYNNHFAGKSRTTRRPELMERMIANLEDYKAAMQGLAQSGFNSPSNDNNIGIVEQNLTLYRSELKEIRNARKQVQANDLAGMLGSGANEVMSEYREHFAGKDRKTRDIDKLSTMCDELRYIQMQMFRLADALNIDFNTRNIRVVEEARAMYENEWRQVREVLTNG